MTRIYEQHAAAFAQVSAFVVLDATGEQVATVAIKFPRDGAGRLYAYFHLIGIEMVRGFAGGYGYDKRSAAVSEAIGKIKLCERDSRDAAFSSMINGRRERLREAARQMHSDEWIRALEKSGYRVIQAV